MEGLFPVITVHCFFHCGHIERSPGPEPAHSRMEQHYEDQHADDIAKVLSGQIFEKPRRGFRRTSGRAGSGS